MILNLKCLLLIFSLLHATLSTETTVHVSTDLASSVCRQQEAFQNTEILQPPATTQPQEETVECAWITIPKKSPGAQQEISKRLCEEFESQSQGSAIAKPRVLGGVRTKKHEFPSLVAIWKLKKPNSYDDWTFFSAGSILSGEWVMTTAHSFRTELRPEYFAVEAGSYNISDYSAALSAELSFVDQIIFHPNYKRGKVGRGHDIALLHMVESFTMAQHIQPAILPPSDYEPKPNGQVQVVGRGKLSHTFNERPSDIASKANFTILPQEACQKVVDRKNPTNVSDTVFCARTNDEASKNICPDDSGGLVIAYAENSTVPVQVGLIGYNEHKNYNETYGDKALNCEELVVPFTITHLAKLLQWIFDITGVANS